MKFGKNVVTDTKYTDGYYKVTIQRYNTTVQQVSIETPEDIIVLKSLRKLQDLSELLYGLIKDWDANETTA